MLRSKILYYIVFITKYAEVVGSLKLLSPYLSYLVIHINFKRVSYLQYLAQD